MVTIGTRLDKAAAMIAIAERFPNVFFTVGVHPHEAAGATDADFAEMRDLARASEMRRRRRSGPRLSL